MAARHANRVDTRGSIVGFERRRHLSLGFADVPADLAALGSSVEWDLFRASDVALHRRVSGWSFGLPRTSSPETTRYRERRPPKAGAEPRGCGEGVLTPRLTDSKGGTIERSRRESVVAKAWPTPRLTDGLSDEYSA